MATYADINESIKIIVELGLEKDREKSKLKEKKAADDKQKERNKLLKEIQKQQLKDNAMPSILKDTSKDLLFVKTKSITRLKKVSYSYNVENKE